MKKQKQSEQPVTKSNQQDSLVTNDLLLVAYVTASTAEVIGKNLAGALARARTECELLLITEDIEAVKLQKEIGELCERQRCRVISSNDTNSAINQSKASWVFMANEKSGVAQVLASFQSNKKQFQNGAVHYGKSGKTALKIGAQLQKMAFNLTAQLVLPLPLKDYTHSYVFFPKSFAAREIAKGAKSSMALLCCAAYNEESLVEYTLTSKEHGQCTTSWGTVLKTAISARIKWFVTDPLKGLFADAKPGNAPINRLAFVLVFLAALILLPKLSFDYGITWDAKRHNIYGYEMLKYFETDGKDKAALSETSSMNEFRYYGEHFNVISAWLNTYIKPWGEFETRHFLNALYGLLAILFAGLAAKEIAGWRAGVLALLAIILSPVFFGHSMNNPTDIPFAAGCAMALYYLLKVLRNLPAPKFTYLIWCGVGIGIAIGARIGGIVFYAYSALFIGLSWLLLWRNEGWGKASSQLFSYILAGITIIVTAHLVGISLWPFGQEAPLSNWYVALKKSTSSEFFTYNHELYEGVRMYMANVPWYYLPKFIAINSPIMVLVGFILLLAMSWSWKKTFQTSYALIAVVLFVFVFPIAYAEVKSMYYYNGWRHYLFTYPPLIVLTAVGWESAIRLFANQWLQRTLVFVAIALLSLPAIWMVRNHPNEVVYYNELVGGTKGAYGNYELDYYSNSCREAAEWIAAQEPTRNITVAINNEPLTGAYYAQRINPNIQFQWVREYEEEKPYWDYAIFTTRTYSKTELMNGSYPPKGTVYKVEVDGVPIAVVVKREVNYMPDGYRTFEANQFDSAIYYFTKACEWNPKDEEAFRMKGMALLSAQSPDSAIVSFKEAIKLYPENYMAYSNMGLAYANAKKDMDKGLECFKKANELKYNFTDAYYYSARIEFAKNNLQGGIKYLEQSLKRGGNGVAQIYYELGTAYYNTGSYTKAEENLKLNLTLNPNNAMAYRVLSEVFTKQGKTREAEFCIQKYRELGGN
jgi:tetratricopeptide (TPR) repeat protein